MREYGRIRAALFGVIIAGAIGGPIATLPARAVAATKPVEVVGPFIDGGASEGNVLQAEHGIWSGGGPYSYTYAWKRCNDSGCVDIPETHRQHVPIAADVGHWMRVVVTAQNSAGSTSVLSNPSVTVVPGYPHNVARPSFTGSPVHGQLLRVSFGTWRGTATIKASKWQWLRCDAAGSHCVEIPRQVHTVYTPGRGEIGHRLRVAVRATNPVGSTDVLSIATAVIG